MQRLNEPIDFSPFGSDADQNSKRKLNVTSLEEKSNSFINVYYGSKKILLPDKNYYIYCRPFYVDSSLYYKKEEIYAQNRYNRDNHIEYKVIFETDDISFPAEIVNNREKATVELEKDLIKKLISATSDEEATEALVLMWRSQVFCDLVIKGDKKYFLAHRIIFFPHSDSLREGALKTEDFIAKFEFKKDFLPVDTAIQQILKYVYENQIPNAFTKEGYNQLLEHAKVLGMNELHDLLIKNPINIVDETSEISQASVQKSDLNVPKFHSEAVKITDAVERIEQFKLYKDLIDSHKSVAEQFDKIEEEPKNDEKISLQKELIGDQIKDKLNGSTKLKIEENEVNKRNAATSVKEKRSLLCRMKLNANLSIKINKTEKKLSDDSYAIN